MDTTAELLRYGLDIIAASPKEDENRQVLYAPHVDISFQVCEGDVIEGPKDVTLKGVLCFLEGKFRKLLTQVCSAIKPPAMLINMLPPILKAQIEMLHNRAHAGGMVCDCCGKTPEELQIHSFMRCSRCAMIFYCSTECQREHWKKKGHKQACRKKGQIEIGDDMQRQHPLTKSFIKVVSCVDKTANRWQVQQYGTNELVTVNGADLFRLRPHSTL